MFTKHLHHHNALVAAQEENFLAGAAVVITTTSANWQGRPSPWLKVNFETLDSPIRMMISHNETIRYGVFLCYLHNDYQRLK